MSLFQSFFILQGCDNRLRFLLILLAAIAIHGFSWLLSNNIAFQFIINIALSYVVFASNLRRITDSNLQQANRLPLFAPSALFLVTSLSASWLSATVLSVLLAITVLSALLPARFAEQYRGYIYGYVGNKPIKQHTPVHQQTRVEPVIAQGESSDVLQFASESIQTAPTMPKNSASYHQVQHNDFNLSIEPLIEFFKAHQRYLIAGLTLVALIMALSFWLINNEQTTAVETPATEQIVKQPSLTLITHEQVSFDDGFSLASTDFNGLVLMWQTQQVSTQPKLLWDKLTEQNDDSCQRIGFNKGQAIELQRVVQTPTGEIQAYFSPLDSQALIQSLAFRGYFKLCGYQFSLKGSQATLAKHPHYGEMVSY